MEQENEEEYVDKSSEVGKLILKLNLLEKRPLLDNSLAEVLQTFMQSLKRSDDFLRNGIFKINFAEAALLLQSSASIYSRKVDLLWDMINQCQKRLVSLKKDENENELLRIEERERKYKRKRLPINLESKTNSQQHESKSFLVDWQEIDNLQEFNFEKDGKLYSEWYKKMIYKWDLQPTQRSNKSLAYKQVQFRSLENAICDTDQDYEFVVCTSKMESVIGLEELIFSNETGFCDFSFELYCKLYLIPKFLQEKQLNFKDLQDNSIEFEKYMGHYRDKHFSGGSIYNEEYEGTLIIKKQSPTKLRRISGSSTVVSRLDLPDFDNIYLKKCQVNVLRLSVDDLSRLSRLSVDEVKKYWSEGEDLITEHFHENFLKDSKENISCVLDKAINQKNTGEKEVTLLESSDDNHVDHQECDKLTPQNLSEDEGFIKIIKENEASFIFERVNYKVKSVKTKRKLESKKNVEVPEKRKKLSKASLAKLAVGITVDSEKFNSFYSANYQPEIGEERVEESEFTFDDPIDSSSRIAQEEEGLLCELSDAPILSTQDSGYESNFQFNEDSSVNDIQPSDFVDVSASLSELNQILEEPPAEQDSTSVNHVTNEEKPLYQRVYEWKQHMSEKFKTLESADFDIHEYGSNIMENFEEGKPRKFSSIVQGKSAADVTRFFISALQLANTNNVEIQGAQSGKLSNETFELKLISKDQYHDRLKDYMAPSEQDYHKRLSSVHDLKKRLNDFKVGESSSCKRKKFKQCL